MSQTGHGRHRAPTGRRAHRAPAVKRRRQPATQFVVGAVASAVAAVTIETVTAGMAHADGSGISWDSIASCESGGNWSINTGNGYLGGLQWNLATYHANGGVGNPANASREQQIAVAEHIIATQGVVRGLQNWPVCGKLAWSGAPSKVTTVAAPAHAAPDIPAGTGKLVVSAGDTLSALAEAHGIPGGWTQLWSANRDVVPDPAVIYPGQQLRLP